MVNNAETHGGRHTGASVGELARQLSEQASRLAHQEVELAKAELVVQGKRVETGLGMFGEQERSGSMRSVRSWPPRSWGWPRPSRLGCRR